ncbi:MAG: hypothetical protein AB1847_19880 [bacterium]
MKFSSKCMFVGMVIVTASIMQCLISAPRAGAQVPFLPGYYNSYNFVVPFVNYGYPLTSGLYSNPYGGWGMTNLHPFTASPYTALSPTGYYGNSLVSPFSFQSVIQPLMEAFSIYNYLQYSINFYEIARDVPLLYLRDPEADQLGALMYSYANSLGVSPQEAVLYFIRDIYFSQPQ